MIRRQVVLSPEARDDLFSLYDWIADHASPDRALAYVEHIEAHVRGFDITSERGTRRDDIRPGPRTVGFEPRAVIAITAGTWLYLRQQMSLMVHTMK